MGGVAHNTSKHLTGVRSVVACCRQLADHRAALTMTRRRRRVALLVRWLSEPHTITGSS